MRLMGKYLIAALAFLFITVFMLHPVAAQHDRTQFKSENKELSFSAIPFYQFDTDLEDAGSCSVRRFSLRFDGNRSMTDDIRAGFGLSYDFDEWDFEGATGFKGIPWEKIHTAGMDVKFLYAGMKDWTILFLTGIPASQESNADLSDSIKIGGILAASYRFSDDFTLGIGAAIYTGLEETQGFPFLTVRWQISEQLLLANPFRPGPTGPAGLELTYALNENWSLAAGASFRSFRFRLDDKAPAPKGIGEVRLVPAWGRVTLRLNRSWAFDLYAGYAFAGELRLEDESGNRIGTVDQDPAPFGAIAVSCKL